jgi:hypothetical protein
VVEALSVLPGLRTLSDHSRTVIRPARREGG